jgi:hypothetical protein
VVVVDIGCPCTGTIHLILVGSVLCPVTVAHVSVFFR